MTDLVNISYSIDLVKITASLHATWPYVQQAQASQLLPDTYLLTYLMFCHKHTYLL